MKNNNILRRLQCLCLTLLLMFTILGMTPVYATGVTEITFGEVMSKVGEEVIVPVTIKNNPGIAMFRFRVNYDTDGLELLSIENGSIITEGTLMDTPEPEKNRVTFTWFTVGEDVIGDGEIAKIKFKVKDTARGNYPLEITYLPEDLLNSNREQVPYTVVDGKISTGSTVSGNVTSFGEATEPVTLRLLENGTEIDKVTSTDGTYSFSSVSPGTYTIEVSKLNHATRTYEITVAREDITEALKIHLLGDVTGDGQVKIGDYAKILAHVKGASIMTGYELNCADVTGDGFVKIGDYAKVLAHVKGASLLW